MVKRWILNIALAAALAPLPAGGIGFEDFNSPIATSGYASLNNAPQGGELRLAVELRMVAPWHINAHDLKDEFLVPTELTFKTPAGVTVRDVVYPAGHSRKLDFAEQEMLLYDGTVYIGVVVDVAPDAPLGETSIAATVTYQACDDEKCLLPATTEVFIPITISGPRDAVDLTHAEVFAQIAFAKSPDGPATGAATAGGLGGTVSEHGLFVAFILVFLGGLALNLTPCVFPIIPITVSYFGGQSRGSGSRTTLLAVLYLLGMAAMYSTLGLIAALTGSIFGSALQNPIVLSFVAVVMVGLAMSMFGFYEIRVPERLAGVAGTAKQGAAGAFVMGLTVGIVAAPCIGPFVLGLLTFVGERADPVLGFTMFFTLALGLGAPYVVLAVASGNIARLPKSGEWMEWVRRLFGVILLGMAIYFLDALLPDKVYYLLMGSLMIVGGIILGWVLRVHSALLFFNALRRTVGVVAPVFGLYLLLAPGNIRGADARPGIAWLPYTEAQLSAATASGKAVVIDFTAEWCLPCKELEHVTFSKATVIEAAQAVVPLRVDLTQSAAPEVRALREKYSIRGVPTVVFIDATGKERDDLRVVQFVDAEEFLSRLAKLGS